MMMMMMKVTVEISVLKDIRLDLTPKLHNLNLLKQYNFDSASSKEGSSKTKFLYTNYYKRPKKQKKKKKLR